MALFRRRAVNPDRESSQVRESINAFWAWWSARGAAFTAAAVADREPGRVVEELNRRVRAIAPGLSWELGPGTKGGHLLVVTSEGDPALRATARRWKRAAPVDAGGWEFSDTRRAAADPRGVVLKLDGVALDAAGVTVAAQVTGATLNVDVYHPGFDQLSERSRAVAAYLLLDTVLGESAVEIWIGTVGTSTTPPFDPVPLAGLCTVVDQLGERYLDEHGEPTWALLEGRAPDGTPVIATAQVPLRPATAPHLDTYVGVGVPFTDRTEHGLPGDSSLGALRALEDHLVGRLGGSGRLVGHETHQGVRVLHLYVDGTTPAADQLHAAASGWDQGAVTLTVASDPGWERVGHLTG